ncbi:MAG: CPBP family intramembrane metalloprotease [Pseudomonadaceae bacterium]|nr:CPBP family intramembrane metalloprotease [Pseudomonadaceae bacterium]
MSRRRLQRDPDFTGQRLTRFRQVFVRHGLPGIVLALCCAVAVLETSVSLSANEIFPRVSHQYLLLFTVAVAVLFAHSRWSLGRWDAATLAWIGYLGLLSIWEEWVFRLAIPELLAAQGVAKWSAVVLVNSAFGLMHYFTLRWRWQWCVLAALGGLALSRHFHQNGDFLVLVLMHWLATTLNTPRLPGVIPR